METSATPLRRGGPGLLSRNGLFAALSFAESLDACKRLSTASSRVWDWWGKQPMTARALQLLRDSGITDTNGKPTNPTLPSTRANMGRALQREWEDKADLQDRMRLLGHSGEGAREPAECIPSEAALAIPDNLLRTFLKHRLGVPLFVAKCKFCLDSKCKLCFCGDMF